MTNVIRTPWDEAAFGLPTYEIKECTENVLRKMLAIPGHYTIKVSPLMDKRLLYEFGFYYCDTLIEPSISINNFEAYDHPHISIKTLPDEKIEAMCEGTFQYDRFHRDFNITRQAADERYRRWLKQLIAEGEVLTLMYNNEAAGFFAIKNERILLHALDEPFRGKGLAKYFWSEACTWMIENGCKTLRSSVSAANLPVMNLYRSLGFSFNHAVDVYHKWQPLTAKGGR